MNTSLKLKFDINRFEERYYKYKRTGSISYSLVLKKNNERVFCV